MEKHPAEPAAASRGLKAAAGTAAANTAATRVLTIFTEDAPAQPQAGYSGHPTTLPCVRERQEENQTSFVVGVACSRSTILKQF